MKNTYSVLGEMSKSWGKMSNKEKQALAITLAGKNQFEVFTSVLGNFKHAQEATQTSIHSSGSAMKENEAYTESLSYKLTMLKKEFKDLANSIVNSGVAKGFVDIGVGALKFVSSDFAGAAIKIGLVTASATGLFNVIKAFRTAEPFATLADGANVATKLGQKFKNLKTTISNVFTYLGSKDINKARTAFKSLHENANKTSKVVGLLKGHLKGLGIAGIAAAVSILALKWAEANSAAGIYKSTSKKLSKEQSELKTNTEKLSKLQSKPTKSSADETEIKILQEENDLLREQIDLTTKKKQKAFEDTQKTTKKIGYGRSTKTESSTKTKDAVEAYTKALEDAYTSQKAYERTGDRVFKENVLNSRESAQKQIKNLEDIKKAYEKNYPDNYKSVKGWQTVNDELSKIKTQIKDTTPDVREFMTSLNSSDKKTQKKSVFSDPKNMTDSTKALKIYKDALSSTKNAMTLLTESGGLDSGNGGIGKFKNGVVTLSQDDLPKLQKKLGLTKDALRALIQQGGDKLKIEPSVKSATKALKKSNSAVKTTRKGYTTTISALKKYGKQQGLTTKQTNKLIKSFKKSGNSIFKFSKNAKTLSKNLMKVGNVSGNSFGKMNKEGNKLLGFNPKKFIKNIKNIGGTAKEAQASAKKLYDQKLISAPEYKKAKKQIDSIYKTSSKKGNVKKVKVSVDAKAYNAAMKTIKADKPKPKKIKVSDNGTAKAVKKSVDSLKTAISNLTDKTITIKYKEIHEISTKKAGKSARGVRNSQKSFLSVVNDNPTGGKANGQYPELIRRANGDTFIANGGEEALVNIGKGDTVYTAKETRQMLSGRKQAIPHFAKGKKASKAVKKANSAYNKAYEKLQNRFQSKLDTLDYELSVNKITEASYQTKYAKLVTSFNKKVKALKKRKSLKKATNKRKSIGTSNTREQKQSAFDYGKELAEDAIDSLTSGYENGSGNFNSALAKINKAKKNKYLTNKEYKEYLSSLYAAKAEHDIKMVKADANSYATQKSNLDRYLKQGVISYEEYYNQLTKLQSTYSSKVSEMYDNQKSLVQKTIDAHVKELEAEKDALSSSNDLLEKQNALATAQNKKVMIYKDGKWQWVASKSEVEEAERNLREAEIDSEIDKWNNILTDYEDKIDTITAEKNSGGVTLTQLLSMSMSDLSDFAKKAVAGQAGAEAFSEWLETNGVSGDLNAAMSKSISDYIDGINTHATGTLSTEPLSIVGEKGAEMHVGSGDGIISSAMTKNLMEWGTMTPTQFANIQSVSNDNHSVTQFNLGSGAIVVNGNNGKDIAEDIIMNFDRIAKQRTLQR